MVTLTESAARKIGQLLAERDGGSCGLRIRVIAGGCSGLRYELQFDDRGGGLDLESEQHGVWVLIDEKSAAYLDDSTLDYVDALNESGFKVANPNASSTCGCGESFGV